MRNFSIEPTQNQELQQNVAHKINQKTKPIGALGRLEEIAMKLALIQRREDPKLIGPHILVFAADHGIAKEGVSAYPPEVTAQMVLNFVNGGAAINVFSRQHGIDLKIIDAGVNFDFGEIDNILPYKIGYGAKNFLYEAAMTEKDLDSCITKGDQIIDEIAELGTNVVGFGEMGIGNTSSASVLMSLLMDIPLKDCVGRGTGLTDAQYINKIAVLKQAVETANLKGPSPAKILQHFGGFEIAMMTAAMLRAAERGMAILVDGFIASSAFLCAYKLHPNIRDYAFFCHMSQEKGHRLMMDYLAAEPLLDLQLRLGEGTGCAVAYPLLQSSILFLNEMASFESAGVSGKEDTRKPVQ